MLFSISIFFIVLRETIEAGLVVSILLSLVDSLTAVEGGDVSVAAQRQLKKRMRWMVWCGALSGLAIAACIGAAFIAVFFTTLSNLYAKSEDLWEGIFSLIACVLIYVMSLGMLRIDRSKVKWRQKFQAAFAKKGESEGEDAQEVSERERKEGRRGKWSLFILPFVTVLRESLEMVVFVGGVSLGQSAKSIPLAAIVGLIAGFAIGYVIFASGSRLNLSIFLVISTNILLLIGAGLFSRGVWFLQAYVFNKKVGMDVEELGDGPGSFDTSGNVWHVTYGNPENKVSGQGWSIFNAILGWQNTATLGSILSYTFYWLLVIVSLVYMKWSEGRTGGIFGIQSAAGKRRQEKKALTAAGRTPSLSSSSGEKDAEGEKVAELEDGVQDQPQVPVLPHNGAAGSEDEIKAA
ncbi:hypothetical protein JCM10213_006230 [Rhodosporidiobolus nylandii]